MIELKKVNKLIELVQEHNRVYDLEFRNENYEIDFTDVEAYFAHPSSIALNTFMEGLSKNEIVDILAIMLIGRGDYNDLLLPDDDPDFSPESEDTVKEDRLKFVTKEDYSIIHKQCEEMYELEGTIHYIVSKYPLDQYLDKGIFLLKNISK